MRQPLLCRRHHTDLHHGHWHITITNGQVHVTRPTWTDPPPHPGPYPETTPPRSAPGDCDTWRSPATTACALGRSSTRDAGPGRSAQPRTTARHPVTDPPTDPQNHDPNHNHTPGQDTATANCSSLGTAEAGTAGTGCSTLSTPAPNTAAASRPGAATADVDTAGTGYSTLRTPDGDAADASRSSVGTAGVGRSAVRHRGEGRAVADGLLADSRADGAARAALRDATYLAIWGEGPPTTLRRDPAFGAPENVPADPWGETGDVTPALHAPDPR